MNGIADIINAAAALAWPFIVLEGYAKSSLKK